MIQTFTNWLRLDAQNLIIEVWWCSLILWCALAVLGITDTATNNTLSRGARAAWIVAIVLMPLAGLFAYCILCLTRADYHMLEFLVRRRKNANRKHPRRSASQTLL